MLRGPLLRKEPQQIENSAIIICSYVSFIFKNIKIHHILIVFIDHRSSFTDRCHRYKRPLRRTLIYDAVVPYYLARIMSSSFKKSSDATESEYRMILRNIEIGLAEIDHYFKKGFTTSEIANKAHSDLIAWDTTHRLFIHIPQLLLLDLKTAWMMPLSNIKD